MDDMLIAMRNKTHNQNLKAQQKENRRERFGRSQKDLRFGDQSRLEYKETLVVSGELCSQDVGKIQHC